MLLASLELINWLAIVCETTSDNVKLWLWVALLAGMLAATIQFVLMMVTRWGNSDPTGKALMCSVLIHLSMTSGAVVVSPPQAVIFAISKGKPDAPRTEIRRVVVGSVEAAERESGKPRGNTPVWNKLPEKPSQELARLERAPLEFQSLEGPIRRDEPLTQPDIDVPDVRHNPELPVARPEIEQNGDEGPKLQSSAPLKIDDPTIEARPDVNVPSLTTVRRSTEQPGAVEITVDRQAIPGAAEKIGPIPEINRSVAAIPLPESQALVPQAMIQREASDDKIERRPGLTPSASKSDNAGGATNGATSDNPIGAVSQPKFNRLVTRTPKMEEDGGTQRLQPELKPSIPTPVPGPVRSVREGIASKSPIDGAVPNAVRPNFDAINRASTSNLPPTYRLRNLAKRAETAVKFGGTAASERTVEASLKWLALHQNPEGFWDADGYMGMCPDGDQCRGRAAGRTVDANGVERASVGSEADSGVTGLVVLAYLGAGYTHEEGPYADLVDRSLSWLIRNQRSDGYLGGKAARFEAMYCHAIATYALAEALGMQTDRTTDRRLRVPLERAVKYILSEQNEEDGGWRYEKGQPGDMSMFGWQLMALKSSEIAGLPIPDANRQLMVKFLKAHSIGPKKGLASYRFVNPPYEPLPATASMTAESLFCKQMLGISRTNPQSQEAVSFLMQRLPSRQNEDIYYWYYGTLAVYQFGGDEWRVWNSALRDYLIADQRTTGHAAGSWDPKTPWGANGGRVFSTALSTLSLEVYYRFLPLYQLQKKTTDLGDE